MMRRMLGVVVALGLFGGGLFAQDLIYPFRGASVDTEIHVPCALQGPASMTVYDKNAWLVFTCADNRVILRRYLNPNDNVTIPLPVRIVTPQPPAPQPAPTVACTVPGMVTSVYGGCVDKNHPSAPNATRK